MSYQNETNWLLQEKYHGQESESFFADCAKLKLGEPLAYLIDHVPFLQAKIYLDSKPLIPRTETEFWTDFLISYYLGRKSAPQRILDLCAGSGCIGVALAQAFTTSHVTFCEIDTEHHETIRKNCQVNGISNARYSIMGGSLFAHLAGQQFDLIVSNPPYIDPKLDRTETSVKNHEPALALYGGKAGLEIISQILKEAPQHLTVAGELWLEHEPEQVSALKDLAGGSYIINTHSDQYKTPRFSQLMLQ